MQPRITQAVVSVGYTASRWLVLLLTAVTVWLAPELLPAGETPSRTVPQSAAAVDEQAADSQAPSGGGWEFFQEFPTAMRVELPDSSSSSAADNRNFVESLYDKQLAFMQRQLDHKYLLQLWGLGLAIALAVLAFWLIVLESLMQQRILAKPEQAEQLQKLRLALRIEKLGLELSNATAGVIALLLAGWLVVSIVTETMIIGEAAGARTRVQAGEDAK